MRRRCPRGAARRGHRPAHGLRRGPGAQPRRAAGRLGHRVRPQDRRGRGRRWKSWGCRRMSAAEPAACCAPRTRRRTRCASASRRCRRAGCSVALAPRFRIDAALEEHLEGRADRSGRAQPVRGIGPPTRPAGPTWTWQIVGCRHRGRTDHRRLSARSRTPPSPRCRPSLRCPSCA